MKKIRNPLTAACAAIDKKLERFDPKWQARHGTGGCPFSSMAMLTRPASPATASGAV